MQFTTSKNIKEFPHTLKIAPENINSYNLLPKFNWANQFETEWKPGERSAKFQLTKFIKLSLIKYQRGRDYPAQSFTSKLSPHMRFGEISSRQIINHLLERKEYNGNKKQIESFVRQLAWREFTHYLLFHFPNTPNDSLNAKFSQFPWAKKYQQQLNA